MDTARRRTPRSEVLRIRVTPVTRDEVYQLAQAASRSESDMGRVLIEEALVERARRRR